MSAPTKFSAGRTMKIRRIVKTKLIILALYFEYIPTYIPIPVAVQ